MSMASKSKCEQLSNDDWKIWNTTMTYNATHTVCWHTLHSRAQSLTAVLTTEGGELKKNAPGVSRFPSSRDFPAKKIPKQSRGRPWATPNMSKRDVYMGKETYRRDLHTRPVKETNKSTNKADLHKRPTKETYRRDLQNRPPEENYKSDLQKRPTRET